MVLDFDYPKYEFLNLNHVFLSLLLKRLWQSLDVLKFGYNFADIFLKMYQ